MTIKMADDAYGKTTYANFIYSKVNKTVRVNAIVVGFGVVSLVVTFKMVDKTDGGG